MNINNQVIATTSCELSNCLQTINGQINLLIPDSRDLPKTILFWLEIIDLPINKNKERVVLESIL